MNKKKITEGLSEAELPSYDYLLAYYLKSQLTSPFTGVNQEKNPNLYQRMLNELEKVEARMPKIWEDL